MSRGDSRIDKYIFGMYPVGMSRYWDMRKEGGRKRRAQVLAHLAENKTLEEIGQLLGGISRQRVSQLAIQGRKDIPNPGIKTLDKLRKGLQAAKSVKKGK